ARTAVIHPLSLTTLFRSAAQTFERERITGRQDAVVNSRRGQSMPPPAPIKNKRTGQQNRQRHFGADAQVLSRPVRGGFVEWATRSEAHTSELQSLPTIL